MILNWFKFSSRPSDSFWIIMFLNSTLFPFYYGFFIIKLSWVKLFMLLKIVPSSILSEADSWFISNWASYVYMLNLFKPNKFLYIYTGVFKICFIVDFCSLLLYFDKIDYCEKSVTCMFIIFSWLKWKSWFDFESNPICSWI